jgi:hypothetical protein
MRAFDVLGRGKKGIFGFSWLGIGCGAFGAAPRVSYQVKVLAYFFDICIIAPLFIGGKRNELRLFFAGKFRHTFERRDRVF